MEFQFCKIRMFWKSVCDLGNTQGSLTRHFKTIKTGVVEMAQWVKEKNLHTSLSLDAQSPCKS